MSRGWRAVEYLECSVAGNPHVLDQDHYWQQLLTYCVQNGAYVGCDLPDMNLADLDDHGHSQASAETPDMPTLQRDCAESPAQCDEVVADDVTSRQVEEDLEFGRIDLGAAAADPELVPDEGVTACEHTPIEKAVAEQDQHVSSIFDFNEQPHADNLCSILALDLLAERTDREEALLSLTEDDYLLSDGDGSGAESLSDGQIASWHSQAKLDSALENDAQLTGAAPQHMLIDKPNKICDYEEVISEPPAPGAGAVDDTNEVEEVPSDDSWEDVSTDDDVIVEYDQPTSDEHVGETGVVDLKPSSAGHAKQDIPAAKPVQQFLTTDEFVSMQDKDETNEKSNSYYGMELIMSQKLQKPQDGRIVVTSDGGNWRSLQTSLSTPTDGSDARPREPLQDNRHTPPYRHQGSPNRSLEDVASSPNQLSRSSHQRSPQGQGHMDQTPEADNVPSKLERRIIRQIEYYFGDVNLSKDQFLLEEMNKNRAKCILFSFMSL